MAQPIARAGVASVDAMCEGSTSSVEMGHHGAHRILSGISSSFLLRSVLSPGVAQAQTTPQPPDTMAARVLACASCHGAEG